MRDRLARYLEPDEEEKLLEAAREPLRTLILLGINTGLRLRSEALTSSGATLTSLAAFSRCAPPTRRTARAGPST